LMQITASAHQRHEDHGHPEIRRRARGVAREDSEPARIGMHFGANADLHGEIGNAGGPQVWRDVDHSLEGSRLERDDFSSNHQPALPLCLSMISFRKPVSTFRDHALEIRGLLMTTRNHGECSELTATGATGTNPLRVPSLFT